MRPETARFLKLREQKKLAAVRAEIDAIQAEQRRLWNLHDGIHRYIDGIRVRWNDGPNGPIPLIRPQETPDV